MTPATRFNAACAVALLALQFAWHVLPRWPGANVAWVVVLGLPLAAVVGLHLARRRSARFWTGVVALLAFCHGVTEAWALTGVRAPGLAEALLSAAAVVSSSWDGMRKRFGGRPAPPAV